MKKFLLQRILATVVMLLAFAIVPFAPSADGAQAAAQPSFAAPHAEGVVLVEFLPGTAAAERASIRRGAGAASSEVLSHLAPDTEKVRLGPGVMVEQAIVNLLRNPNVRYAEPDYLLTHEATSNDPYYTGGSLWGMYGDATSPANQYGSGAGEAWGAGYTGSSTVYVGVIDEGVDFSHPDLKDNVWTNPFDPVDSIDNDGNGFVDDVHGWDFYYDDSSVYDGTADDHATHVAGTIGAKGGNGIGVAGVNWNITMISTKFLGPGGGYTSDAVAALDYLTDLKTRHGLNIVATNNSWGGGGYSQTLLNAINRSGSAGILFVAAAGNGNKAGIGQNNDTTPSYPSNYAANNVIAVAAITSTGSLASFSNYGATSVDIGAPGVGVYSTLPANSYGSYSGTSMATPHVTGALALYAAANPGVTASDLQSRLLNSARATGSLVGKTSTGGRLDIGAMLVGSPTPVNHPPVANPQTVTTTAGTAVSITLTGSDPDGDTLSFAIVSNTSNGTLSGAAPNLTYTPDPGFVGQDSFTFAVSDGKLTSAEATVDITVDAAPAQSFSVTASPSSRTVRKGKSASYSITVASIGGYSLPVTLALGVLPGGCSFQLTPSSVAPPGTSTLKVSTSSTTTPGTYTLTVTGTGPGHSETVSINLTVK